MLGGGTERVTINSDGMLQIRKTRFVEIEPFVFRQTDGQKILVFSKQDARKELLFGTVFEQAFGLLDRYVSVEVQYGRTRQSTYMYHGNVPTTAFIKLLWYETLEFQRGILMACMAIFILTLLVWLLGARRNRSQGETGADTPHSRWSREARWLAAGVCALFIIGTLLALMLILSGRAYDASLLMNAALFSLLIAAVLTFGAIIFTVLAWKDKYWSVGERLHYTLITLTALVFTLWLNYWNLLGF